MAIAPARSVRTLSAALLFILFAIAALVSPLAAAISTSAAVTGVETPAAPPGTCNATVGVDYPYNDIEPMLHNVTSAAACCSACRAVPACVMWVWAPARDKTTPEPNLCWRKHTIATGVPRTNRVAMYVPPGPPTPPPPPPQPPVSPYSVRYRNWTYYQTPTGFVVPPVPTGGPGLSGAILTDCGVAWEAGPDDPLPGIAGKYRMFYTYFNNIGYQTALATSTCDHWFGRAVPVVIALALHGLVVHGFSAVPPPRECVFFCTGTHRPRVRWLLQTLFARRLTCYRLHATTPHSRLLPL